MKLESVFSRAIDLTVPGTTTWVGGQREQKGKWLRVSEGGRGGRKEESLPPALEGITGKAQGREGDILN